MSRITTVLLTAALGLGLAATAAGAHPRLQAANPASGAMLKTAPKDIRLSFSEELVPAFTGLELKMAGGKTVSTGKPVPVAGDRKKIVVPIGARLMPGTYNVAWHAVSVDTHRISGNYSFKVMKP